MNQRVRQRPRELTASLLDELMTARQIAETLQVAGFGRGRGRSID